MNLYDWSFTVKTTTDMQWILSKNQTKPTDTNPKTFISQLATQPNHLVCLQWTYPDTWMCFLNNPLCTAAMTALQTYRAA